MLKSLFSHSSPKFWFGFHVILGMVSTISSIPLILYFYFVLIFIFSTFSKKESLNSSLSYFIVYLNSFELLTRVAKASPFIPYELGKYLLLILLFIGIIQGNNRGRIGVIMFICLLPALFFDRSGQVIEKDIRFNLLGPLNIGLSIIYFTKQKFSREGFFQLLIFLIYPLISALVFTFIKTPEFSQVEFSLGANFATTGGFGSNQASTAFGLGFLLSFYLWLNRIPISGNRIVDAGIFFLFLFQGLLSFSRGGMIGGFIGVLVVFYYLNKINFNSIEFIQFRKIRKYILPLLFFMAVSIYVANVVSGGYLLLRYRGETAGTLSGSKDKSLSSISTNRSDIFFSDLDLFYDNVFLGVGAGASTYLRKEFNGVLPHVETSRLLAEHGVMGVVFLICVLILFIQTMNSRNENLYKGLLLAFLVVGWYTTFHAATRTFIPPLLIGLSTIKVVRRKPTPHIIK
jgi:hypothetical protein